MHTPQRLQTLLLDDDPVSRADLRRLLEADPEVEVVEACGLAREAVHALQRAPVDLLLLEVELPDGDGFEVLRAAGPGAAASVAFVTADERHALRAFDAGALHYLLKPVDPARLAAVLGRAKAHVRGLRVQGLVRQLGSLYGADAAEAPPLPPAAQPSPHLERLAVKDGSRVLLLPVERVDWVEADDYYVQVHAEGRSHLLRQTLREVEAQLDPRRFLRIHRSTLVNVDPRRFLRIHRSTLVNVARVKELQPLFHGEYWVVLHDGSRLKLSRSYRDRLDALLAGR